MAIYRPPKSRWPLVLGVGVVATIVGLVAGLLVNRDDEGASGAVQIRNALLAAAGAVEVATIEYEEAVDDGNIVSQSEYSGAQAALASGRERYQEVRDDLATVAPERAEEIDAAFEQAVSLLSDAADPSEVIPVLEELEEILKR